MMLAHISLRNFQGHRSSDLSLSPGVNAITGQSDAGKSSIIRALWWLLRNRPGGAGERFKHHQAGEKEEVSVTVAIDDHEIVRYRKGSENGYKLDGEKLVAIRSDVPAEVEQIINLGDHNIQTQHRIPDSNPYFLVEDSPGDVARKLNEVCGLDIIDECLRNAGLLVTRNGQEITECKRLVESYTVSREKYTNLGTMDDELKVLEKKQETIDDLDSIVVSLDGYIQRAAAITEEITIVREFLTVDEEAQELFAKQERIEELNGEITALEDQIKRALDLEYEVQEVSAFLLVEDDAAVIFAKQERIEELNGEITVLDSILTAYRQEDKKRYDLSQAAEEVEIAFHTALEEAGVCPLCDQKIPKALP